MTKNVILITVDSLRRDSVGFLNSNSKLTPFLDKLAAKSTVMTNAFSAGGGTIYAMSSLMTSSFPILNLKDRNIRGWPTLAESFRNQGYRTAAFHSNPWLSQAFGFDQGFEEFRYIVPSLPTEDVVDVGPLARRIPEALNEFANITLKDSPLWIRAPQLFQQATRWVNNLERHEPYFLWIHPMDVHFPYTYPSTPMVRMRPTRILRYGLDFLMRYSNNSLVKTVGKNLSLVNEYQESVRYLDDTLESFCEEFSDSLIIIMADHGDLFGEHGYFLHPGQLYNEIIRIPVIIYNEGHQHRLIDVGFSGVEVGDLIRLISLANDSEIPEPGPHSLFSIHVDYNSKVRRTSVIDGPWKLMVTENLGTQITDTSLYNIEKDPREQRDSSNMNQDIVGDLMQVRTDIMKNAEKQKLKLTMRRLAPMLQKKIN
jgi:arylsulfatase A-like enzyme